MSDAPERLVTSKCGKMIVSAGMKMFDSDVEWIRANLYEAERAENERLREALERLRKTAALLQQNAEGCAANHYGEDFQIHGMPGWLTDTAADIARAALETKGAGNE